MTEAAFLQEWVKHTSSPPLLLTGSLVAITAALAPLRAAFAATDLFELTTPLKTLAIDDIRTVQHLANQRAWSGQRLIIIHEAEKLSPAAANALLKTLEDSTKSTRFILTTQWSRRLLPTIRSRCIQRRVSSLKGTHTSASDVTLPSSLLARLSEYSGEKPLDGVVLEHITMLLEQQLREAGPSPTLKAAYQRLKDYYLISSFPGGNHKLARDVLLASLPLPG